MDWAGAAVLFCIFSGMLLCAFRIGYLQGEYQGRMDQIKRFEEHRRLVETLVEGE